MYPACEHWGSKKYYNSMIIHLQYKLINKRVQEIDNLFCLFFFLFDFGNKILWYDTKISQCYTHGRAAHQSLKA